MVRRAVTLVMVSNCLAAESENALRARRGLR